MSVVSEAGATPGGKGAVPRSTTFAARWLPPGQIEGRMRSAAGTGWCQNRAKSAACSDQAAAQFSTFSFSFRSTLISASIRFARVTDPFSMASLCSTYSSINESCMSIILARSPGVGASYRCIRSLQNKISVRPESHNRQHETGGHVPRLLLSRYAASYDRRSSRLHEEDWLHGVANTSQVAETR